MRSIDNHKTAAVHDWSHARLRARPAVAGEAWEAGPGLHPLELGPSRDGYFYVPPGLAEEKAHPLLVMLHGAGGAAEHAVSLVRHQADALGIILLAPDARAETWDAIRGDYGPDVVFLDRALEVLFGRFTIDAARIAIGGFSDGASYALSLGLANGDLIGQVLAFSPGFAGPAERQGRPRIFISHGAEDTVLPAAQCGRKLARDLQGEGYDVDYREFPGGHVIPPEIAEEAMHRL